MKIYFRYWYNIYYHMNHLVLLMKYFKSFYFAEVKTKSYDIWQLVLRHSIELPPSSHLLSPPPPPPPPHTASLNSKYRGTVSERYLPMSSGMRYGMPNYTLDWLTDWHLTNLLTDTWLKDWQKATHTYIYIHAPLGFTHTLRSCGLQVMLKVFKVFNKWTIQKITLLHF